MAANLSSGRRADHQLLKLVDNFAEEALSRERAIDELKRKRTELASEVESAFADLERINQNRISAQEEVREVRVELEAIKTTANFKQAKLSIQQEEISKTSTSLKNLEDEGKCSRDSFISTIMEINMKVRKMRSAQQSGTPQPEYQSFRSESRNLENSHACCEPGIVKTSTAGIKDEAGVRHEEQLNELLERIQTAEAMLLPVQANLDNQQEKVDQQDDTQLLTVLYFRCSISQVLSNLILPNGLANGVAYYNGSSYLC